MLVEPPICFPLAVAAAISEIPDAPPRYFQIELALFQRLTCRAFTPLRHALVIGESADAATKLVDIQFWHPFRQIANGHLIELSKRPIGLALVIAVQMSVEVGALFARTLR